jgi:hypothetical protein
MTSVVTGLVVFSVFRTHESFGDLCSRARAKRAMWVRPSEHKQSDYDLKLVYAPS